MSIRQWIARQHPLVRLYIYFIASLFVVLLGGSVYFIIETKYLIACGACLVPFLFFGSFMFLAIREQKGRWSGV